MTLLDQMVVIFFELVIWHVLWFDRGHMVIWIFVCMESAKQFVYVF